MLPVLLSAGLLLSAQVPPAPHGGGETPAVVLPIKPKPKHSVAVPETETPAASEEPKKAKAAPKPTVTRKPPVSSEHLRLAEAEALTLKLVAENARLQQEMARAQGIPFAEITTPDAALAELSAGNARFVAGKRIRTLLSMQDTDLRGTLAKGQAPFAVIVTCSDSRLVDTLIFDQELGRLFTIREAGNSPDIQGLASIEYALEHLGSKLVMVLGHTSCGAIKAVQTAHGATLPGNLWSLQAAMAGLLEATPEDPNEAASEYTTRLAASNAQRQVQVILDRSEIVRHLSTSGKVKVVPALYDLATGKVGILERPKAGATPSSH